MSGYYHIETYGCQMNVRDSETVAGILEEMGFRKADSVDSADIILFNTCCVRDHAEKRLMGNIGALYDRKQENPNLIIGILGCMVQQKEVADKLFRRFPYVDLIMGTNSLDKLAGKIEEVRQAKRVNYILKLDDTVIENLPAKRSNPYSSFVNIMFGCNNYCSYCIVPYVRGPERSRTPEAIIKEVGELVDSGISEITLLGQNVNSYGKGSDTGFPELLRKIDTIQGLRRIRFMTSHPKDLSDSLIEAMRDCDKVCPHVHLPLQSGSDSILKKMNRKYNTAQYLDIVEKLRKNVKDIELTTDIIVGFPGETEDDFNDTLSMMKKVEFANAFTFKYSKRAGTVAAKMDGQIPEVVKKERLSVLNALQKEIGVKNNEKYLNYCNDVLVEGFDAKSNTAFGKYPNFKMVYFDGTQEMVGTYQKVLTTTLYKNSLKGSIVK